MILQLGILQIEENEMVLETRDDEFNIIVVFLLVEHCEVLAASKSKRFAVDQESTYASSSCSFFNSLHHANLLLLDISHLS